MLTVHRQELAVVELEPRVRPDDGRASRATSSAGTHGLGLDISATYLSGCGRDRGKADRLAHGRGDHAPLKLASAGAEDHAEAGFFERLVEEADAGEEAEDEQCRRRHRPRLLRVGSGFSIESRTATKRLTSDS